MITITYNESNEMMEIKNNEKVIFYGNYWDFNHSPHGLKDFLEELNLKIQLNKIDEEML